MRYLCEYCGMVSSSIDAIVEHEAACKSNPKNITEEDRLKARIENLEYVLHRFVKTAFAVGLVAHRVECKCGEIRYCSRCRALDKLNEEVDNNRELLDEVMVDDTLNWIKKLSEQEGE